MQLYSDLEHLWKTLFIRKLVALISKSARGKKIFVMLPKTIPLQICD